MRGAPLQVHYIQFDQYTHPMGSGRPPWAAGELRISQGQIHFKCWIPRLLVEAKLKKNCVVQRDNLCVTWPYETSFHFQKFFIFGPFKFHNPKPNQDPGYWTIWNCIPSLGCTINLMIDYDVWVLHWKPFRILYVYRCVNTYFVCFFRLMDLLPLDSTEEAAQVQPDSSPSLWPTTLTNMSADTESKMTRLLPYNPRERIISTFNLSIFVNYALRVILNTLDFISVIIPT